MSKHVSRKKRWTQLDSRTHSSTLGKVFFERNAWHGLIEYRTQLSPVLVGGPPRWEEHTSRLGPYKRPRNAMVALEREATVLKNRFGDEILFGDQLWVEGIGHSAVTR